MEQFPGRANFRLSSCSFPFMLLRTQQPLKCTSASVSQTSNITQGSYTTMSFAGLKNAVKGKVPSVILGSPCVVLA